MAEEDVLLVLLVLSNFLSAYYTAFCIEASTKRYHWFYKSLHQSDLNWYATWYSCQTIALLVSSTNTFIIYTFGARLREWILNTIRESYNCSGTSTSEFGGGFDSSHDKVLEKAQENEMIQGQLFTTLWSSTSPSPPPYSSSNYSSRTSSRQHILPVYNDCPFTTSSARRLFFVRSRQIRAWWKGFTGQRVMAWMASLAIFGAVILAVWNVGFAPFWVTLMEVKREDKVVMIPWNYTK